MFPIQLQTAMTQVHCKCQKKNTLITYCFLNVPGNSGNYFLLDTGFQSAILVIIFFSSKLY